MRYKPYPKYKDSGVVWLGNVPEEWEVKKTKYAFSLIVNPAPKDNNYELLSIYTDIGVKPRKELEAKGNKSSTTDGYWIVKKGDLIVNKLLAWMGAIGYSNYNGVTSPAYDILRANKNINSQFYGYLFRTKIAQQEFKRWSRGIMEMRLRLYFSEFGNIPIPIPPIDEQIQIANYLDQKTKKIDTLITKQQTLIELLKEKQQALISHVVTKGLDSSVDLKDSGVEWLGGVPEHWGVKKTKYCFKLIVNPAPKNNNYQLLSIYTNIGVKPRKELEQKGNKSSTTDGYWIVKKGDLIVNKFLAWMGAIGYSNYNGVTSPAYDILRSNKNINSLFYSYLFRSKITQQEFKRWSRGIMEMRLRLYFSEFGNIFISIPPIEEQNKIVEYIKMKTKTIDTLITKATKSIELLKERRTALISAVVSGKVDVRDYNKGEKQEIEIIYF
jgi:type I restriction enzyme S subunit